MTSGSYLGWLQKREPEMLRLLQVLVNMDTPSSNKDLVDAAIDVVEEQLEARGARVERKPQPEVGDHLIARWPGRPGSPRVLIASHLDTVWPEGEAQRRPFTESHGKLIGPGVFDMKAGLVQAIFAVDAVMAGGDGEDHDVTLLVNSDEETGSRTSRELIETEAAAADLVLVVEPASGPKLKTARKGIGMYTVIVEGRASHAGLDPEQGRSAVLELAHQIIVLHALNDLDKGTTVSVGLVRGGTGRNVVPAHAEATVDLRVVTTDEAQRLDAAIRALRPATPDTKITVVGGIKRPPMERSAATGTLYARASAIAKKLSEELGECLVGGGSDGNFTAAMGVPTLDGLGAIGAGAHAIDEYVEKSALTRRAALLAELIHDLGENGDPAT